MDESVFSLALCSYDEKSFDEIYDALEDDSLDDIEDRVSREEYHSVDYTERYGDQ